ncbi:MAG: T9SS type A sorting domain-containing protein [Ignavibacteriaceae bacterium]|nr:T9SS type A sorting domain-containing protein [Ignavibacteriaceae bacterium]
MRCLVIFFAILQTQILSQISFDANFESGNINTVTTSDSVNYNVTTKTDIGGRWFYFRIKGVKNKFIRVTITSSDANRPMYSYNNREFTRFTAAESPSTNLFQKTFTEDTVYIAYYTPYNYSYLQEQINKWKTSLYVNVDTLGLTDHGLPIQQITITDFSVPDLEKHRVWIHARTHPGETPSSWHLDGIIRKLLSDDDVVSFYRQKIVFYLIPFTNPDGVYYGRSRTNYNGVDIESNWDKTESQTSTEVKILKQRMAQINNEKVLSVFNNLHSQAAPYCTFWIHTPGSTTQRFYRKEYQFSNLNTSDNPYFDPGDYSESNLASRYPEGWLWNNHGEQVMALTYETPYDQYSTGEWVTNSNLMELGYRNVYAIAEYLELSHPKWQILDNKNAFASGNWNPDTSGLEFLGDDFLVSPIESGNSTIEYISSNLSAGVYDVYGWWPSSNTYSYNTRFTINANGNETVIDKTQKTNGGQWNFLTETQLESTGNISIKMNSSTSGFVAADAFRIIYRAPLSSVVDELPPSDFNLYQNYPNPFNAQTTIRFELKKTSKIQLKVFNAMGELVETLVNQELGKGVHEVIFNTTASSRFASGTYYYNLLTDTSSQTRGMILLK